MDTIQFCYFNSLAWYGARLCLDMLKNFAHKYDIKGCTVRQVTPAQNQPAIMLSFLADREFFKIFKALELAQIPRWTKDRQSHHPIVIAGGAAMFQPEPIADMVDVICVGDGEEFLIGLQDALSHETRQARIDALAELPGAYVPSRRTFEYHDNGVTVKDVTGPEADRPIVPHTTNLWLDAPTFDGHQREIEIARGCNMTCNFCSITWRNDFRERPLDNTMQELRKNDYKLAFFAPNTGGVKYYDRIHNYRGKGSKGDITVTDFLKLPYPKAGEYAGHSFTFGMEGMTPRLRRIVGKPISWDQCTEMMERLFAGGAIRLQLYFIRNVPGETMEDWQEWRDWFDNLVPQLHKNILHTELLFTPLTKQAHTPFQWFNHFYDPAIEVYLEDLKQTMMRDREDKLASGLNKSEFANIYIAKSRQAASWLIDNVTNMAGRNGAKFLWAQHKGATKRYKATSRPGAGYDLIRGIGKQCGFDTDFMIGDIDIDDTLPYGHIIPGGTQKNSNRVKVAKSLYRRIRPVTV